MREKFCQAVVKNGRAGYVAGVELVSQLFGNLENLSAQAAISTTIDLGADIGMRQWFYQSCTEFGYWQNVNPVSQMRTRSLRINATYHNNLCQRLFGMDAQNVQQTNKKYYEPLLDSSASAILFTNGDEDPWMNLSIVTSDNQEISTMLIPGAAHCDDLGSKTTPAVEKAKKLFDVLSFSWAFIN